MSLDQELKDIYLYIDGHIDKHVGRLQEWIQQPSVSNTCEGVEKCAELTRQYFCEMGCHYSEIVDVGITEWGARGNPIVYAEYHAGAPKTLLLYMMYDTMPYGDPSDWCCHPLDACIVEQEPFGRIVVGRGAGNSKGPVMVMINALEAIHKVTHNLPVNLIVVAEGDEERMSIGLRKFVNEKSEALCDADALLGWGGQYINGVARMMCGSEGCLYLELETSGERWGKGPSLSPIHGKYKLIVDSPVWRHIKMLSTLVDETGNEILVPGWYRSIEKPTAEDIERIKMAVELIDIEDAKKRTGINEFINNMEGGDALTRALYGTSLNIDGIWGGLTEQGSAGSVLPHKATSKHNIRYVPAQEGSDLLRKLRAYLDSHGYDDVDISVIGDVPWVKPNYDTDIVRAVYKMYEKYNVPYLEIPGSGFAAFGPYWPAYLFAGEPLKLPVVMAGLGHGGKHHAVDEYFVLDGNKDVYGMAMAEKGFVDIIYNYAYHLG